jgi:serine/threonine protein kinase
MDEYYIVKKLGYGGFSLVYLLKGKNDGKYYVAKFYKSVLPQSEKDRIFKLENFLMNHISHPRLLKTLDVNKYITPKNETRIFTITDFIKNNGDLEEFISKKLIMDYDHFLRFFIEMIDIVDYLHNKNIIHNDIKPSNILLDIDNMPILIDFDASCTTLQTEDMDNCDNKLYFMRGTKAFRKRNLDDYVNIYHKDTFALALTMINLLPGKTFLHFPKLEIVDLEITTNKDEESEMKMYIQDENLCKIIIDLMNYTHVSFKNIKQTLTQLLSH